MDFGEILEQWDKIQKESRGKKTVSQVSHKKANAPTKEEKLKKELTYEQQMKNDAEKKISSSENCAKNVFNLSKMLSNGVSFSTEKLSFNMEKP